MKKRVHPVLYTFIGGSEIYTNVKKIAESTWASPSVFSLHVKHLADLEHLANDIRVKKAEIQMNENELDLQAVDIYVVVEAIYPDALVLSERVGRCLNTLFAEDFISHRLSMALLISESNKHPDYEKNNMITYAFLSSLGSLECYGRIFLLSDRNELGVVSQDNFWRNCDALAHLPLVNASHFDEISEKMRNANQTKILASIGIWRGDSGQGNISAPVIAEDTASEIEPVPFSEFMAIAQLLEENLNNPVHNLEILLPEINEDIAKDIMSVASNLIDPSVLAGKCMKQTEVLLFGHDARDFYQRNYYQPEIEKFMAHTEGSYNPAEIAVPLSQIAGERKYLDAILPILAKEISETKCIIKSLQNEHVSAIPPLQNLIGKCKQFLFAIANKLTNAHAADAPINIDFSHSSIIEAKQKIVEYYALEHKLLCLELIQKKNTEKQKQFVDYLENIENTIQKIKSVQPPPEDIQFLECEQSIQTSTLNDQRNEAQSILASAILHEKVPLAISLIRNDALIHESHLIETANHCAILRLIAGFAPEDLTRYPVIRGALPRTPLAFP